MTQDDVNRKALSDANAEQLDAYMRAQAEIPHADADTARAEAEAGGAYERDENGLTEYERNEWRALHFTIEHMTQMAVTNAPTYAEVRRRIALVKLCVRMIEAAAETIGETGWTQR